MRRLAGTAAIGVALTVAVGCDQRGSDRGAGPSPSVLRTSLLPVPASPSGPAPPRPSPAPPRRSDCVASTEEATVRPNEEPGPICLLVGATLRITAAPSPSQPWQLLSTSDAAVLPCTSTAGEHGTVNGTCQARGAGTAVVSTQTKSPADGASDRWRLTVIVAA